MSRRSLPQTFVVPLEVTIRGCVRDDLVDLEWFGHYSAHREIIRTAFDRQERGEVVMLVAEADRFPIGQVWIDLTKLAADATGLLWALRVLPGLRGRGIGARLVAAAEQVIHARGLARVEIGVEKGSGVGRFYERLGYRLVGEMREEYSYTTPGGEFHRVPIEEWIFRKELGPAEIDAAPAGQGRRGARRGARP